MIAITDEDTEPGIQGLSVTFLMDARSIGTPFARSLSVFDSNVILYSRSSSKGLRFKKGHFSIGGLAFFSSEIQA